MRADLAALGIAQLMGELLGTTFTPALRTCRRHRRAGGDPLLRAGVDDRPGVPCAIIAGAKACTPLITPQRLTSMSAASARGSPNTPAPLADAGVVHQHADLAEGRIGRVPQTLDLVEAADVAGKARTSSGCVGGRGDARRRRLQRLARCASARQTFMPSAGELSRCGEADAAGGAGDDGDAAGARAGWVDMGSPPESRASSSHVRAPVCSPAGRHGEAGLGEAGYRGAFVPRLAEPGLCGFPAGVLARPGTGGRCTRLAEPGLRAILGWASWRGRPRRGRVQAPCTRLAEPGLARFPAGRHGETGLGEAGYTGRCSRLAEPGLCAIPSRASWRGRPRRGRYSWGLAPRAQIA